MSDNNGYTEHPSEHCPDFLLTEEQRQDRKLRYFLRNRPTFRNWLKAEAKKSKL